METCRLEDMQYTNLGVGECECVWGVREGREAARKRGKIYDIFSPWIPNSNFARDHPTITKLAGNAPTPPSSRGMDGWTEGGRAPLIHGHVGWGPQILNKARAKQADRQAGEKERGITHRAGQGGSCD